MNFWPEEALAWYQDASEMFDYPMSPYGKMMKHLIQKQDSVLDLGCGPGVASIMIAPWCNHVLALDSDEQALHWLTKQIEKHHLNNIEIINDSWPVRQTFQVDVIIALHVYGVLRSLENVELMYSMAKKGGLIACNAPQDSCKEPFIDLKKALGIKPRSERCDNGCWIKGVLEALGASVKCEKIVYEFGQPLNTMEEAVRFIRWQSGAAATHDAAIKKYAKQHTTKKNGKIIVPITRESCALAFEK